MYNRETISRQEHRISVALDLAGVEKGEVIPDSAATMSDFLLLSNYYLILSTNSGTEL